MSGSGRCNGYGSQLWREPTVASFPFRQTFEPDRVALTPLLPLVLSPGFEPGLDASLAHCLCRLGHESMRRQSAGICPRSPLWIRPLVPDPCTHARGGRACCDMGHDMDHRLTPMLHRDRSHSLWVGRQAA